MSKSTNGWQKILDARRKDNPNLPIVKAVSRAELDSLTAGTVCLFQDSVEGNTFKVLLDSDGRLYLCSIAGDIAFLWQAPPRK